MPVAAATIASRRHCLYQAIMADDTIIQTPDGPMTWAEWKKKHPIQIPSRRTKHRNLDKDGKPRED
jgi:hypothetical protein